MSAASADAASAPRTVVYVANADSHDIAILALEGPSGGDAAAVGTKDAKMVPLGLSSRDRADLVAFLRALSGDAVPPALLMDTSGQ